MDANSTMQDVADEFSNLGGEIQVLNEAMRNYTESVLSPPQVLTEMQTLSANLTIRIAAVEDRLTARETAHHALVNQLNDILGQMQVKLQGALELKPEIMPYDQALAAGYMDEETGIKLRADATAQRKFTSQLAVATAAIVFGGAPASMPMDIWDFSGKKHVLPFTTYLPLMIRLSQWIGAIEARF